MTNQQDSGEQGPGSDPSPFGPPSPLEPAALALGWQRPVTRGFVLLLTALVLVALFWVDHRQAARIDQLGQYVGDSSSASFPSEPDAQTCWLLGVAAGSKGSAGLVSRMGASTGSMSDCQMYATRGSLGQDLEGN